MSCPYCNSSNLTDPTPLISDGADVLIALGIHVPSICQCNDCTATLSEECFTDSPRRDAVLNY